MAERPGGSPFLLVELLSGLREEGLVRVESGRAELVEWRLPHRVSQSMRLRLERMSDSARQVATVAAALGRRFSLDDVAAMLNLSPSELLTPVDELVHADVLAECDGRLMFGHDLTLEAVRASVPVSVLRSLDRQAASVLLAGGALPVEVATQLAESAEPGDEVAITTLLKAAEALGATDPGAAADLSQRALELAPLTASFARAAGGSDRGLAARRRARRGGESVRRHGVAPGVPTRAGSRGPPQHRRNVRPILRRARRGVPPSSRPSRSPGRPAGPAPGVAVPQPGDGGPLR